MSGEAGEGLNLTWEVRDGIWNHKFCCTPHTLEGQIVRLSDKIAYINHDIDDAIREIFCQRRIFPGIQACAGIVHQDPAGYYDP